MQYVYVLRSRKDKDLYVGCTKDLKNRLVLHNAGKVLATKNRTPFEIIYYEAFLNKYDAFARERFFKTGWGRNQLNRILEHFLMTKS